MKQFRIYVDTSVIGGCLDDEFAADSLRLIQAARDGQIVLLASAIVARELSSAPREVLAVLEALPSGAVVEVPFTDEVLALRDAYLAAGVVGPTWLDDAAHVASATVAGADAIASWNFRHIVRLDKIQAYNEVNRRLGYKSLIILSPREVQIDESEED